MPGTASSPPRLPPQAAIRADGVAEDCRPHPFPRRRVRRSARRRWKRKRRPCRRGGRRPSGSARIARAGLTRSTTRTATRVAAPPQGSTSRRSLDRRRMTPARRRSNDPRLRSRLRPHLDLRSTFEALVAHQSSPSIATQSLAALTAGRPIPDRALVDRGARDGSRTDFDFLAMPNASSRDHVGLVPAEASGWPY